MFGVLLFIIWGWAVAWILQSFLICSPLKAMQTMSTETSCDGLRPAFIAGGAINLFTDLVILVLPLPFVWRLQLTFIKRIAIMGFFGLGIL
jgi:hypothetical protein